MYYVYILKLTSRAKHPYYIGFSNNLRRRLKEHQSKNEKVELIYYEAHQTEKPAREREKRLKYYGSAWRGLKNRLELA